MRNCTSDLWIPCSNALPLSYWDSKVSAWGPLQSSYMTHILHTATCRISNVNSFMIAHRIRDISPRLRGRALEHKIRRSVVWFLMGTQNFFFVPCLWQDKKHISLWPFWNVSFWQYSTYHCNWVTALPCFKVSHGSLLFFFQLHFSLCYSMKEKTFDKITVWSIAVWLSGKLWFPQKEEKLLQVLPLCTCRSLLACTMYYFITSSNS